MLTKKYYELIAGAIAESAVGCSHAYDEAENEGHARQLVETANCIADACARDNPRFDRARFLKACGVQS